MLLVGVDEAGYGPVLGPLVISTVAFDLPDELSQLSLWQLLTGSVTQKASRRATKLVIADSKKVYRGRSDLRNLERSALAAVWAAVERWPDDLMGLLKAISIEPDAHLQHPWYCKQGLSLPVSADRQELAIAARMLVAELWDLGATLSIVKTVPVVESRFNHLIGQTRNKSSLLFSETMRLVDRIFHETQARHIVVYLDKHGGKNRYDRDLLRAYGSADLEVLAEGHQRSSYRLTLGRRVVEMHFVSNGESQHLPVALASIISKYVRELFMTQLNRYWVARCPDLKPTAGYWTDGKRFVNDLVSTLGPAHIPTDRLVRRG